MSFVLDASVAMTWCFTDQASANADALLDRLGREEAVVPSHWALEIANILALAERRNRIDAAGIAGFMTLLRALKIRVNDTSIDRVFTEILAVARAERLPIFDAAYLNLAMRESAPLATREPALIAAASRVGVDVIAV
jgi:predicted nucleic acid-binding protein